MAREDRRASDTVQDGKIFASDASNVLDKYAGHLSDARQTDARRRTSEWKTFMEDKTRRTTHDTTEQGPRLWTQTHIWCEPAQSKCTWTCHKSRFILKFAGKMPGPERVQNADTHFVRACAVKMRLDISQEQLYRRKFRSQTSDNMDRWKAEQGRGREKRKIRREKIRRERVRGQKVQMREKVGKSRNTVFFKWFVAPEGRKVGSLKRRVRT